MEQTIYTRLRQLTALASILRDEAENLEVKEGAQNYDAWNRLVELSYLLTDQLSSTTQTFEEYFA